MYRGYMSKRQLVSGLGNQAERSHRSRDLEHLLLRLAEELRRRLVRIETYAREADELVHEISAHVRVGQRRNVERLRSLLGDATLAANGALDELERRLAAGYARTADDDAPRRRARAV
jgi:hypothetical protein